MRVYFRYFWLLVFAFSGGLACAARASSACQEFYGAFSTQGKRKVVFVKEEGAPIVPRERKFFLEAMARVDEALVTDSSALRMPPDDLTIRYRRQGRNLWHTSYEDKTVIEAPYQYYITAEPYQQAGSTRIYARHPKYSVPIFMHEYGHYLYQYNFARHSPEYALLRTQRREALSLAARGRDPAKQAKSHIVDEAMDRTLLTFGMFDEFFADFTAVMTTKDPQAVFQADNFWKEQKMLKKARHEMAYRDFSDPLNALDVWRATDAPHDALAPTRYFLYENFLRYPRYQDGPMKQKLIDEVFLASVDAFKDVAKLDPRPNSTEINRIFIDYIRRRMGVNP